MGYKCMEHMIVDSTFVRTVHDVMLYLYNIHLDIVDGIVGFMMFIGFNNAHVFINLTFVNLTNGAMVRFCHLPLPYVQFGFQSVIVCT